MKNQKFNKAKILTNSFKSDKIRFTDEMAKRIETLSTVIQSKIDTINGLVFRNGGRGLIGLLLQYIRGVRPRASKSVVKQISGFVFYVCKIARHSGIKGVVIYLKACQVLLQQCVGGYRVVNLDELKVRPSRNRAGVPLIIPAGVRVLISRDRDISSIRLWMTLLGLFRILEFPGSLNLDTIISKGPNLDNFIVEWEEFLSSHFKPALERVVGTLPPIPKPTVFPILKSGPVNEGATINSSPISLIKASRLWLRSNLIPSLKTYTELIGMSAFFARLELVAMACEENSEGIKNGPFISAYTPGSSLWHLKRTLETPFPEGGGFLGKLGFKEEPAGKIRVFAMVDAWTQWLMFPLHKWLFNIISQIKEDGTFDQLKPVEALQSRFESIRKNTFSSIDLSAATDRLPIRLQESIIKILLEDIVPHSGLFAKAWSDILVGRYYSVASDKYNPKVKLKKRGFTLAKLDNDPFPQAIKYGVGQPMGALSSWAMLAMTHHAIIQFCYYKAYGNQAVGWFENYAVLGDDVVIADGRVAEEYRRLLVIIGVKAGMAKSIIARGKFVIEFAKKFFVDKTTANMLPLKECVATLCSTSLVLEFTRKYSLNLNAILSFLGFGFKAKIRAVHAHLFDLSTRLRVIMVWLSHPLSPIGKENYIEWIYQKSWNNLYHLPKQEVLWEMADIAESLAQAKIKTLGDFIVKYERSTEDDIKYLNINYPIEVTAPVSSSVSESGYLTKKIPWKAILNPDLSPTSIDEYDFLTGGMSVHAYRFQKLEEIKLGVDVWDSYVEYTSEVHSIWENKMQHMGFPSWTIPPLNRLEISLFFLFDEDQISSQIPKKFWAMSREVLKPFRDFLETYRIWQEVSKPLWADYYKSIKVKPKIFSKINGTLTIIGLQSSFQIARGDLEGSPNIISLDQRAITANNFFNYLRLKELFTPRWDSLVFILGIILGWLLMELNNNGLNYTDILIDSTKEVTQSMSDVVPDIRGIPLWPFFVGAGIFVILISFLFDYLVGMWIFIDYTDLSQTLGRQDVPIPLIEENLIRGPTLLLGIPGSLTPDQLERLQSYLATQAWLDNLALSPIGELWTAFDW